MGNLGIIGRGKLCGLGVGRVWGNHSCMRSLVPTPYGLVDSHIRRWSWEIRGL